MGTEAEDKQKDQRGDIEDRDIFGGKQPKDTNHGSSSERKLFAVKTVSKAARSKQSDLLKKKGFGLVVSKIREKNKDILDTATVTSKDASSSASATVSPSSAVSPGPTNSLSLLGCEYGDS